MPCSYHLKCKNLPLETYGIRSVFSESTGLSISSAANTPLYTNVATTLLVATVCGMAEGLKGRVTNRIT